AHTLRGSAANIGASAVATAASDLQQACKSGASSQDVDRALANVMAALRPLLDGLARMEKADVP
ncbi:Hpt domain-containing protein, partial [Salmonella enterica]